MIDQHRYAELKALGYEMFHDISFYSPALIKVRYFKGNVKVCEYESEHNGDRSHMQAVAHELVAQCISTAYRHYQDSRAVDEGGSR